MIHVVGNQNQVGGPGLREIADAPRINVNDLAAIFELDVGMGKGRDRNVAVRVCADKAGRHKNNEQCCDWLHGSLYATSSPGLIELLDATTMYCLPSSM